MIKQTQIEEINCQGLTPEVSYVLSRLNIAGYPYALFGGALRDLVWNKYNTDKRTVKDYDVRVWSDEPEEMVAERISELFGVEYRIEPSLGTGKPRYILDVENMEIDLSIRAIDRDLYLAYGDMAPVYERVQNADAALGSAAVGASDQIVATTDFLSDLKHKQITMYGTEDKSRLEAYTKRMQEKFPGFELQELKPRLNSSGIDSFNQVYYSGNPSFD